MPDTTEHPPIAGRSAAVAISPPAALAPADTDFFDIVHDHSMVLLEIQEQALRYAVDRTQDWIDCGAVWMKGCSQLPREAVDASRDSIRMAIEDSAKLFRLWTEIGFQVAAPFAGPKTRAN
jgi:hypothetical protein